MILLAKSQLVVSVRSLRVMHMWYACMYCVPHMRGIQALLGQQAKCRLAIDGAILVAVEEQWFSQVGWNGCVAIPAVFAVFTACVCVQATRTPPRTLQRTRGLCTMTMHYASALPHAPVRPLCVLNKCDCGTRPSCPLTLICHICGSESSSSLTACPLCTSTQPSTHCVSWSSKSRVTTAMCAIPTQNIEAAEATFVTIVHQRVG
jgi:hypothetical protein